MTRILLDIRDVILGALISDGNATLYDCSFDSRTLEVQGHRGNDPVRVEEMLFRSTAGGETLLSSILSRIIKDAGVAVDTGYLLMPDEWLIYETITLPKINPEDTRRLLERKFNPKGTLQLHVSLVEESPTTQIWSAEYLPSELVQRFQKAFKTAGIKLQGITTASHVAIYAVPSDYIMGAGLVYALYDISLDAVEGFYFFDSRLIHHERYVITEAVSGQMNEQEEQFRKMTIFRILDGIYRINANFDYGNPDNSVHQLLLCGTHPQIQEISDALIDAMGVEGLLMGLLLGDLETVSPFTGRYALLAGYAQALQIGMAADFMHHELLPQRALHARSGVYIYAITALLAFASLALREVQYRKISSESLNEKQALAQLKTSNAKALKQAENLALLKKELTANPALYGLFRDLANNLPDGIYLKGITIKLQGGKGALEILTVTKLSRDIHNRKLLSKLNSYITTSGFLRLRTEPVITVIGTENDKSMQMKFVCELEQK